MLIAISGMISSGKSTLVKQLSKLYQNQSLKLDEYESNDSIFESLLDWFLQHKPHVGLSFDIYVMDSHVQRVENIRTQFAQLQLDEQSDFIFLDRFPLEHYIFACIDFASEQDQHYLQIYKSGIAELVTPTSLPDFVIYLDMDFETFKTRLLKRSRPAEINNWDANLEYWAQLHSIYKTKFIQICEEFNVKYQILDTNNKNEEQVLEQAKAIIHEYQQSLKLKEQHENSN
ncbi:deoxynucleoside kinase [Mycoplasmopsis pullorum]|uniref:Deoxynucleoside kinase domain-containing protein n=1 Tax=Mycoplasmopsis pullorum TaxID=48003 RepID=A0A1L4FSS2_9BACT|nr:deoxynucleoside kinase [Mycoplasmopsis pullorum]APJ38632.1 hypothetical protein BLA55_03150 [Mycoplasmopsis pullorum]